MSIENFPSKKDLKDTEKVNSLFFFLGELEDFEVWKEIKNSDGKYFASDKGRVLSLCQNAPRILKP